MILETVAIMWTLTVRSEWNDHPGKDITAAPGIVIISEGTAGVYESEDSCRRGFEVLRNSNPSWETTTTHAFCTGPGGKKITLLIRGPNHLRLSH